MRRLLILALIFTCASSFGQKTYPQFAETSSIAGSDLFLIWQNSANKKFTFQNLLNSIPTYNLPTASTTTLGGVKVGANLAISGGVLTTNGLEPSLGNPSSDYLVLTSTTGGARSWVSFSSSFAALVGKPTTLSGYGITDAVPATRTINAKSLSSNVTLTNSDIGSEPTLGNPAANGYVLSSTTSGTRSWISNKMSFASLTGKPTTLTGYGITDAVPSYRAINSKALSANITLNSADVGAEPAMGNPSANGYIMSSTTSGVRSWIANTGLIPTDNILKWNTALGAYTPYFDRQQGKFYGSGSMPINSDQLNYDGILIATQFTSSGLAGGPGIVAQSPYNVGLLAYTSGSGAAVSASSDHGVAATFDISPGNTSHIIDASYNEINKFYVDRDGNVNIPATASYLKGGASATLDVAKTLRFYGSTFTEDTVIAINYHTANKPAVSIMTDGYNSTGLYVYANGNGGSSGGNKAVPLVVEGEGNDTVAIFKTQLWPNVIITRNYGVETGGLRGHKDQVISTWPQTEAGTGAHAELTAGSSGLAGEISLTTGTSSTSNGHLVWIGYDGETFSQPPFVTLTATNGNASLTVGFYVESDLNGFWINKDSAPATETAYKWVYHVIQ